MGKFSAALCVIAAFLFACAAVLAIAISATDPSALSGLDEVDAYCESTDFRDDHSSSSSEEWSSRPPRPDHCE